MANGDAIRVAGNVEIGTDGEFAGSDNKDCGRGDEGGRGDGEGSGDDDEASGGGDDGSEGQIISTLNANAADDGYFFRET